MPFRDDYEAALERVAALEAELARVEKEHGRDHTRIAELEGDLHKARASMPASGASPSREASKSERKDEDGAAPPDSKRARRRQDQAVTIAVCGVIFSLIFVVALLPKILKWRAAGRGYDWSEKLTAAMAEARSRASDAQLKSAYAKYVDSDGHIVIADWTSRRRSSGVRFEFRSAAGAKAAPAGMLGAPSKGRAADCEVISVEYTPDAGWLTGDAAYVQESDGTGDSCTPSNDLPPRCTFAQVWKRAIELGAPHPALARISVGNDVGGKVATLRAWRFEIVDSSSGTKVFVKDLPDDCR